MKNIWKRLFLTLILIFVGFSLAQIRVGPLVIFAKLKQGQAQSTLSVSNLTNEPIRARVSAVPFTYAENGFTVLPAGSDGDLTPYLQFAPREFVIPPNKGRVVRIVANIPPSAPLGEYRAILFAEQLNQTNQLAVEDSVSFAIKARVGTTVFVHNEDAEPNISVLGTQWDSETNQLNLRVANSGEASVRVATKWSLKRDDEVIKEGDMSRVTVVAESERYITLDTGLGFELSSGEYTISGLFTLHQVFDELGDSDFEASLSIP